MKIIIATLALLTGLTVPALAQTTAGMEGALAQKSSRQWAAGQLIGFNKGALLQCKGGFAIPQRQLLAVPKNYAAAESRLSFKPLQLQQRGGFRADIGLLHQNQSNLGNRGDGVRQRSRYFRSTQADWRNIRAHVPGIESAVRETLTYHFAWKGGALGLAVKDLVAKDDWYLKMACTPKLKKESDNRYTAQVACYGRLGYSTQQLPVVLQFTLLGSEKNWKIHGLPTVVSANRITRPGQNVMANVWADALPATATEAEALPAQQ